MPRCTFVFAMLFITAISDAALAENASRAMPVVPSDDILTFEWKDYPIDHLKASEVDLSLLPDAVRALQGQRIRVRGFVMPAFQQKGIRRFVLQSYYPMTFGRMPVDALMAVDLQGDDTISFTTRPITLEGTLTIDDWMIGSDSKEAILIYRLHDAKVYAASNE